MTTEAKQALREAEWKASMERVRRQRGEGSDTATAQGIRHAEQEEATRRLQEEIRRFSEAWAPEAREALLRFNAELTALIHRMHMESQRHTVDQLARHQMLYIPPSEVNPLFP